MDITIQNVRSPALEHNGRYYKVFQPRSRDELLKLHHMGCVGDTVLTDIQIEQGDFPTHFVEPTITQRSLSGLFKDMRNIELELRDPNSTLWGKIQQNNQGALSQFFDKDVKSAIAQTANEIRQEVQNVTASSNDALSQAKDELRRETTTAISQTADAIRQEVTTKVSSSNSAINQVKQELTSSLSQTATAIRQEVREAGKGASVSVTSRGVTIGATTLTGKQLASVISTSQDGIDLIAPKIRVQSDMIVDGSITGSKMAAGSVTTTILDAEAVTADKVRMDQAFANLLVSSNIFTDTLAAKEAFINKLRSVVVTATFLEGFQGKIGGFLIGRYKDRNGYFITGTNSVSVGMGNGTNAGVHRNAFWANWGDSFDTPGPKSWYVNTDGKMYCRNDVDFHSKVDFSSTSKVNFYSKINAPKGVWVGTDDVNGEGDNPDGGYNRVVWWSQIVTGKWRQYAGITTGSDRKLKENIGPTPVNALDKINALNLVAFDYIKDKTHEEIGLIAQEVLNIIPGAVEKYEGEDNYLTINYSKFVPYLIKAIQELNQKLEKTA